MIELKDIEIKYGDFTAIKKLNLTIHDGEFFTFLGPSGCGKTTTLRCLAGFIQPSKGAVIIDGKDVTSFSAEKRRIGMVFQSYALFPTMTVYENLAFGLKVKKLPKDVIDQKVRKVAETVSITPEQLSRGVSELSGGQQQRVALARAIVLEPRILCLDEPLSNLDAKLRVELRAEIKALQSRLQITTLYVTHDQTEALTLSDRIAVFRNGAIEQVGTPYEIYNKSSSRFVCGFIGDINHFSQQVVSRLIERYHIPLDASTDAFIRIERMHRVRENADGIVLRTKVLSSEFDGSTTKYTLDYDGQTIKFLELNDGSAVPQTGKDLFLSFDPEDVLQYHTEA